MWKESIADAAEKLGDALIHKYYEPNEDERVTRDRIVKLMGDPFGLERKDGVWKDRDEKLEGFVHEFSTN
jgi:hypothetical protein